MAALVARCRPAGMAQAMVAMAGAQAIVGLVTPLVHGKTVALSVLFAGTWLVSAVLFRKAARAQSS